MDWFGGGQVIDMKRALRLPFQGIIMPLKEEKDERDKIRR